MKKCIGFVLLIKFRYEYRLSEPTTFGSDQCVVRFVWVVIWDCLVAMVNVNMRNKLLKWFY
jgi:hypothetical protein